MYVYHGARASQWRCSRRRANCWPQIESRSPAWQEILNISHRVRLVMHTRPRQSGIEPRARDNARERSSFSRWCRNHRFYGTRSRNYGTMESHAEECETLLQSVSLSFSFQCILRAFSMKDEISSFLDLVSTSRCRRTRSVISRIQTRSVIHRVKFRVHRALIQVIPLSLHTVYVSFALQQRPAKYTNIQQ